MPEFDVVKGHRDCFGSEALLRNRIRDTLRSVFERYGYIPLETPALEYAETLAFKGGGEIKKEIYQLTDQGERKLALRFDHTVPLARFVASNHNLKFPLKRYAIGPVFRDGPTQPEQGRYRSFTQCDADILGIKEMTAEAELFALAQDAFEALGLGGVDVKVNNRKLLEGVLDCAGVPESARLRTIATLDKLDKDGLEGVRHGLENLTFTDEPVSLSNGLLVKISNEYPHKGIKTIEEHRTAIVQEVRESGYRDICKIAEQQIAPEEVVRFLADYQTKGDLLLNKDTVTRLLGITTAADTNEATYQRLADKVSHTSGREGLAEVRQLLNYAESMGFDFIRLEPSLARGLDYYTGTTLEVFLKNKSIVKSAILAGGRFDNMVGDFRGGNEVIPAVGFSFGLERLVMIMEKQCSTPQTPASIYLIPLGTTEHCLKIAHDLRRQGVNVDMDLQGQRRVGKSISYADSLGITYVGIIGEDEIREGAITLKNLRTKEQRRIKSENIPAVLNQLPSIS